MSSKPVSVLTNNSESTFISLKTMVKCVVNITTELNMQRYVEITEIHQNCLFKVFFFKVYIYCCNR